jgi:hypothetical protein
MANHKTKMGTTMKKNDANKRKLRKIAKAMGFKTVSSDGFMIFFFGAKITTDRNVGPRIWEWRMLHELGHAELMLQKERCHVLTLRRWVKLGSRRPSEAFFRDYLNMEWKAWEHGLKIAEREGIKIHKGQYLRHARKCYGTYVRDLRNNF